jgi:hypothetical protein
MNNERSATMKAKLLAIGVATTIAFTATPVLADHNSKNGEGWANMPNDIHNTRIETKEADDNEAFRDFVKYGEGSESVNRFASEDTTATRAKVQSGNAQTKKAQTKQMDGTMTNSRVRAQQKIHADSGPGTATKTTTRVKEQRQLRTDTATRSSTRQRSKNAGTGGRKRGGKH